MTRNWEEPARYYIAIVPLELSNGRLVDHDQGHAQAMLEVRGLYLEWRVERLRFIVEEGAKSWRIVQWEDS
jgi:hypothetical protein